MGVDETFFKLQNHQIRIPHPQKPYTCNQNANFQAKTQLLPLLFSTNQVAGQKPNFKTFLMLQNHQIRIPHPQKPQCNHSQPIRTNSFT